MKNMREESTALDLKFDANGLVAAVATDVITGELLMLAHMNETAFQRTVETGRAHFWSRSRKALWMKGETSGNVLEVQEIRVDCDQDAVWLKVAAAGAACHTGRRSCFYRRMSDGKLVFENT
ncbi:MAG: phosphoribosyl-AMP cyclohydrolase [Pseudomonadota bacterium]